MYKLTLYFNDKNAIIFKINSIRDIDNILMAYPDYIKMTLEQVKTLKR